MHECVGRGSAVSADLPSANQLGVGAKCRPRPNVAITKLPLLIGGNVLLLGVAKRPNLIALNALAGQIAKGSTLILLTSLGDTTDAEDLTQEAFLLLFRKIHTFRGESAFSTWLHRLVVNTVLMHLRKRSVPVVPMETGPAPDGEASSSSVEIATSDLLLEGSIDRINLGRCVAQLRAGSRAIFVLHDIQGYQHHEIAEMLGRSEGVSKSQLHRARKRLRELLHEFQREKYRDERQAAQKALCQTGG